MSPISRSIRRAGPFAALIALFVLPAACASSTAPEHKEPEYEVPGLLPRQRAAAARRADVVSRQDATVRRLPFDSF